MDDPQDLSSLSHLADDSANANAASRAAESVHSSRHSLLLTKLQRPPLPPHNIARPRLVNVLKQAAEHPLTLVSAPTGFGKSTLVAQGLAELAAPCAWLTIDEYDNDLLLFLDYLITAIRTQFPEACPQTQRLLDAVQTPPAEYMAVSLINELQTIATAFVLVLDDFHHLTDIAIRQFFMTLLRAWPAPLHLILITQNDPPWPLERLAGRGQLLEIRGGDLLFRLDEARAFLETATRATLAEDVVEALVDQTEGWIVALRLATLAATGEHGGSMDLSALTARADRLAPRLLVQEVLARQSPPVRDFLLCSAVLDRLSAPLCAALLAPLADDTEGRVSGESIEHWLRNTNLFVVPIGESSDWYRLHHLFRDLLRRELALRFDAERIMGLHRRASDWYASHGLVEDALRHALAAGDALRAADIIEPHLVEELNHENWRVVERWLTLIPQDLMRQRPAMLLARAWVSGLRFENQAVVDLVATATALVMDPQSPLSEADRKTASGQIAALRAYGQWWSANNVGTCLTLAREALADLPRDHFFARSTALYCAGVALYAMGHAAESLQLLRGVAFSPDEPAVVKARALVALAVIYRAAGPSVKLDQTIALYRRVAEENDLPLSRLWACYFEGSVQYERNELLQAVEQFEIVAGQRYLANFICARDNFFELALAYQAQGRLREANAVVRDMKQYCVERGDADEVETVSLSVRLALARQDVDVALRGAGHLAGVLPASRMFLAEAPVITRAQALLAAGRMRERREALDLLAKLEVIAESMHAARPLARILALQAVGLAAEGREAEALTRVERAVRLAQPLGLIRTFVDVGVSLASLLRQVLERNVAPAYLRQVLAAFTAEFQAPPRGVVEHEGELLEPLTEREIEVLRLLAQRLTNKEIAARLTIAPQTAKKHVLNIMAKLGVHSRREAVQKAQALGLRLH